MGLSSDGRVLGTMCSLSVPVVLDCQREAVLQGTIIIIMYIYHALINALSPHMIHINLNMIFCTRLEHSPTETIYIKYY